ncbi:hypothetical protein COCON_G00039900 [Conger conger]|uniref:Bcl-x interacting BH3 domain-containing protein n=1 Tax=Conger conger TaxID=82655 RepID=A0A9Q1E0E9_CONCO|nr:hypothetical protein COCON_G00039900 [Conger conger]
MTGNRLAQAPSPSGQSVSHAQQRSAPERQSVQYHEVRQGSRPGAPVTRPAPGGVPGPLGFMQPEQWVGQELKQIGDEMNQERHRGRRRWSWIGLPVCHWLGLLLGRLLQMLFRGR